MPFLSLMGKTFFTTTVNVMHCVSFLLGKFQIKLKPCVSKKVEIGCGNSAKISDTLCRRRRRRKAISDINQTKSFHVATIRVKEEVALLLSSQSNENKFFYTLSVWDHFNHIIVFEFTVLHFIFQAATNPHF